MARLLAHQVNAHDFRAAEETRAGEATALEADPPTDVHGGVAFPKQAGGVASAVDRGSDERSVQRQADLAVVGVSGQVEVHPTIDGLAEQIGRVVKQDSEGVSTERD